MLKIGSFIVIASIMLVLSACGSSSNSRYSMDKDAYPDRAIKASEVKDAVPKKVVRTKAGNKSPYTVLGKTYRVMPSSKGFTQTGEASWYGKKFHGHKTSNGETYDMYGMSAAHKTLPIPTYVRVTNLDNGLSTVVRVNDRGPFHGGRIIDLSYAAATKLDYAGKGTARIKVEALEAGESYEVTQKPTTVTPSSNTTSDTQNYHLPGNTYLQVAAYSQINSAEKAKKRLRELTDFPVTISHHNNHLYKVLVGPIVDNFDLLNVRQMLVQKNFGNPHVIYD